MSKEQEPEDFQVRLVISWLQKQIGMQKRQEEVWTPFKLRYDTIDFETYEELWKTAKEKIIADEKDSTPAEKKAVIKKGLQGIIATTKSEKVRLQAMRELAELEGISGEDGLSCAEYADKIKEMNEQDACQFGVPPEDAQRLYDLGQALAAELMIIEMEDHVKFYKVRCSKLLAGATLVEDQYCIRKPSPEEPS